METSSLKLLLLDGALSNVSWLQDAPCKGGSTLKNPFQPKLSCDSMTDFDRVDFYWEKKKLD